MHLAIEAFRGLPKGTATLRIYGELAETPYRREQRRRAEGLDVEFRGAYHQDDLYDVFRETDVLNRAVDLV
jgi:hypothetical protein